MPRITTGSTFGLNVKQTLACRMMAMGNPDKDIMECIFKVNSESSPAEKGKARKTLNKWMQLPGWQECFKAIVREVAYTSYGAATQRIIKQVDDPNGWLANKAANDILTRFGPLVTGSEDKQVVIRVEGAPTLGAPTLDTGLVGIEDGTLDADDGAQVTVE